MTVAVVVTDSISVAVVVTDLISVVVSTIVVSPSRLESVLLTVPLVTLTLSTIIILKMYISVLHDAHIKTHNSESQGQEEAGCTRQTSELFIGSAALKFVNALKCFLTVQKDDGIKRSQHSV